ncbi:MAG: sigma-70 family RNA polymerase sigma factor [Lachnospiraceae bacterium]|nr:sigma-70 family RNA polymerase sigma factor [Lachnospiraceae bacterium]
MEDMEAIYQQYYEDVFRFLRGLSADELLAEELTQETFFRAIKSINQFKGNSDIRVWLCSIAKNLYFTYLNKEKRFEDKDLSVFESEEKNFMNIMVDKELAIRVHRVLHSLREPYKEIFSLRVFGELSFKEIAMIFGKTEHWACVSYHRAKQMIQNEMNRIEMEELQ